MYPMCNATGWARLGADDQRCLPRPAPVNRWFRADLFRLNNGRRNGLWKPNDSAAVRRTSDNKLGLRCAAFGR